MYRFCYLVLGLSLFAIAPAAANTTNGTSGVSIQRPDQVQFAQVGRCKEFGKANSCRATYDRRQGTCLCAGK